jgi:hypothetical protein
MMQPAEIRQGADSALGYDRPRIRNILIQRQMCPGMVVIVRAPLQHTPEMRLVE